MFKKILRSLDAISPAPIANAHCDGPCGVYDPASARITAEAVKSMIDKIIAMKSSVPDPSDPERYIHWHQHLIRYTNIKEEQAEQCKKDVLILWTDAFNAADLVTWPNLHTLFWETAKLCSSCKQDSNAADAEALLNNIRTISDMYWQKKGRNVEWYLAKP